MSNWQEFMEKEGRLFEWPYPIRYEEERNIETDVLVIGGGIAGCHAGINAAKKGAKVIVCDTAPVMISGCGGTGVDHWHNAATNPCCKITPEEMTEALVEGYGGYDSGFRSYIQCKESYEALLDCEKMGIQIRDVNDEFKGAEFRDDKSKLMFAYDYENKQCIRVCGATIKSALYKELRRQGVDIFNWVRSTSLLTEGGKQGTRVVGATAVNIQTGEFYIFKAKATVLSTGDIQRLWDFSSEWKGLVAHTQHDTNCVGAGYAMGWNAGAEFALMEKSGPGGGIRGSGLEFAGYPQYGFGNSGNTWFACTMVDSNGKEIPWIDRDGRILKTVSERYRPAPGQKFLLPGLYAFANTPYEYRGPSLIHDLAERIKSGEFVPPLYADLPGMPEHERRAIWGLMVGNEGRTRYAIYHNYARAGFDPDKDMLQASASSSLGPVGPGGERKRTIGGIGVGFVTGGGAVVDWDLRSTLEGLYAAGMQMLNGSDHSSAAATGRYAGRKAAEYTRTAADPVIDRHQVEVEKERVYAPTKRNDGIGWKELNMGIAKVMQAYCGVTRHESLLKTGLRYLSQMRESEASTVYARNPHELMRALDCQDILTCGEMTIHQSLARKASSRFLNFMRLDYPEIDPPEWHKFITIKLEDGDVKVGELPINYWLLPPHAPTYEENYKRHCSL